MSEETTAGTAQTPENQVQVLLDERELRSIYSNAYFIHQTNDEVIVDLAFNMPNPRSNPQGGQLQLLCKISDRVILTYPNAKRLAASLSQLIRRYEQQFGEIPVRGGTTTTR
jgi:hypothetical protein